MDDKGRVFQKLDKDELKEVSGGYVYCKENAPKAQKPSAHIILKFRTTFFRTPDVRLR